MCTRKRRQRTRGQEGTWCTPCFGHLSTCRLCIGHKQHCPQPWSLGYRAYTWGRRQLARSPAGTGGTPIGLMGSRRSPRHRPHTLCRPTVAQPGKQCTCPVQRWVQYRTHTMYTLCCPRSPPPPPGKFGTCRHPLPSAQPSMHDTPSRQVGVLSQPRKPHIETRRRGPPPAPQDTPHTPCHSKHGPAHTTGTLCQTPSARCPASTPHMPPHPPPQTGPRDS